MIKLLVSSPKLATLIITRCRILPDGEEVNKRSGFVQTDAVIVSVGNVFESGSALTPREDNFSI